MQSDSEHHDSTAISASSYEESSLVSVSTGCFHVNPSTKSGKRVQLLQMLVLPFIPIAALIIQNCFTMYGAVIAQQEASFIEHQIDLTVEVGKLLAALQAERSEIAYYVFTNGSRTELAQRFSETDEVLRNVSGLFTFKQDAWNSIFGTKANYMEHLSLLGVKRYAIMDMAEKARGVDDTAIKEIEWYNVANDLILDQLSTRIRESSATGAFRLLIAFQYMIRCIENFTIAIVYGLYYFGKGKLSNANYVQFVRYDSLAQDYLNATQQFSPAIHQRYDTFVEQFVFFGNLTITRQQVYSNALRGPDSPVASEYYRYMNEYINELRMYQWDLRDSILESLASESSNAEYLQTVTIAVLAVVLVLSPLIIILVRNATNTIQVFAGTLVEKSTELKRERRRCDRLLCQMLPAPVARMLKQRKQVPAESFDSVTIYFSDIVGFTQISASSTPLEIITFLNNLYKMFDSRIERYDVYKVETIGDAYMVVSGLPQRNGIQHAAEICTMSLDLINGIRSFRVPHRPNQNLEIRIGVNSGSCVAGVVGTSMPRYCLFGDAINTASRMESTGEAMKVQLSTSTKLLLDQLGGFLTESRAVVEVKGKGMMETFWLVGKEGGLPRNLEIDLPGFMDAEPEYLKDFPEE